MTLNLSTREHAKDPQAAPTVGQAQALLTHRGYGCGPAGVDGRFGAGTDAAARRFQTHAGIGVDGIVGPQTMHALEAQLRPAALPGGMMADAAHQLVTGPGKPRYIFGAEVVNLAEPHPAALDCSELVQWAIFQATRVVWRDGSWLQAAACRVMPVDVAIGTRGALLFVTSTGQAAGAHHVAVSMGDGSTAEARSTAMGCGSWPARGRFNLAGWPDVLR